MEPKQIIAIIVAFICVVYIMSMNFDEEEK